MEPMPQSVQWLIAAVGLFVEADKKFEADKAGWLAALGELKTAHERVLNDQAHNSADVKS